MVGLEALYVLEMREMLGRVTALGRMALGVEVQIARMHGCNLL
jgi:hypothetical protein